ncbi:MAG: aminotransferase class I/II-fold pyridoxal phosphate-dependent enzyme [Verrucomicrobiae bacterium]|nr:aminotransferase class I/II-fold pyridoxal phosphate-dependent enzyme [Verrucomicrobiae bacterium]
MREAEPLQQVERTYIRWRGRKLSYYGGCDYFRLASHPLVHQAIREGLRRYGLNVAASRLTTGNHQLYQELEKRITQFFGAKSALLVSTGYVGDLVVAQSLAGQFSHALLDERAHIALKDAAQLLDCPVLTFKHQDIEDYARTLRRCGREARPIVLTDGMFSHDGSVAPLRAYLKLLPRDGLLLVDDAHGGGTVGKTGKGAVEVAGVSRTRVIQNVTLSKAFGVYGGVILCSPAWRARFVTRSRLFVGSTPLPLPLAAGAVRALELLQRDKSLRRRLNDNASYVKQALQVAGVPGPATPGPIVSWHPRNAREAASFQKRLLAADILPPLTRYPGGPPNGYYRFVISSEHSRRQLDRLIEVFAKFHAAKPL